MNIDRNLFFSFDNKKQNKAFSKWKKLNMREEWEKEIQGGHHGNDI